MNWKDHTRGKQSSEVFFKSVVLVEQQIKCGKLVAIQWFSTQKMQSANRVQLSTSSTAFTFTLIS